MAGLGSDRWQRWIQAGRALGISTAAVAVVRAFSNRVAGGSPDQPRLPQPSSGQRIGGVHRPPRPPELLVVYTVSIQRVAEHAEWVRFTSRAPYLSVSRPQSHPAPRLPHHARSKVHAREAAIYNQPACPSLSLTLPAHLALSAQTLQASACASPSVRHCPA